MVGCCLVAAAGCADEPSAPAAVAVALHEAVADGDGDAACRLLAPATLSALETDEDADCVQAILDVDLPHAGGASSSNVFSGMARVMLDADTVFLTDVDGAWRVIAAGCVPRGDSPYECTVAGG